MVPEKDVVVLLAALRVAHEAHCRGFRTGILDDADVFPQEIVHQLQRQGKVLSEQVDPAVGVHQALTHKNDPSAFSAHHASAHHRVCSCHMLEIQ